MVIRIASSAAVVCAALLVGGLGGCQGSSNELGPVTPAEKTKATSARLEKASEVMAKGEKLIADGAAERSKGMAMKQMGNELDGEKYVTNGESKIRQGQTMVRQAREYEKDTLAQAQRNAEAQPAAYKMQPEVMMPADEAKSDAAKSEEKSTAVTSPSQP